MTGEPTAGASPNGASAGLVLAVVGTDVHRFDRLMDWLERWHASRADRPEMVVQHGYSRRPHLPGAVDFLGHEEVHAAIAAATLVVTHAGPASIIEVRRAGRLPIVVPRDPARGEHVDDHQQRFARRLADVGAIRLCEDEAALTAALDAGLADPRAYRLVDPVESTESSQAVARVGRIVEELVRRNGRSRDGTRSLGRTR